MNRFSTLLGAVVLGCSPGFGFFASGADAASTALIVGGKGSYAHLTDEQMSAAFGGYFAGYDTRISVDFPGTKDFKQSVQVGGTNLYNDVYTAFTHDPNGVITIGGVSEGAPAVTVVLQSLAQDLENQPPGEDNVPDPEHLNATVYAYPSKALRLGTDFQPFPETPYDLLFVFAEYDGVSDFPDNPFNLLAVVNAVMGGVQLHVDLANFPILSQPTDWVSVTNGLDGTTTTIMIPTPVLPLLEPLQNAGASPQTIANLDKVLRPMIDRAYHRPAMTSGVIPPTVVPWPPGYTPPPEPAAMVATSTAMAAPAAETPAPASVDHARIDASIATPATRSAVATTTDVVSDLPAPPASVVTTEDENTDLASGSPEPASGEDAVGDSAADDQQRAGNTTVDSTETGDESSDESADATKTGGRHRARADASHADNGGTAAGSSASRAGKHSAERKFGHHT